MLKTVCFKILTSIVALCFFLPFISAGQKVRQNSIKEKQPIIHTVKPGETLFSIAKKNKVKPSEVKKWNKLKSDNIRAGQKLIVGYAKKKTKVEAKKVEKKPAPPSPVVKPPTEIPKTVPKVQRKPEPTPVAKKAAQKEITEQGIVTWIDDEMINPDKYYALHRTAPNGTIIKITNGVNGKNVYVKVVGKLSARDEAQNVLVKISKSAADKLEISDERFQAELSYSVNE